MGRTTQADWHYRVATALSPLSTRAHNKYGSFLLKQGRTSAAQAEFERSVVVDPTDEALDHLGDIYLAEKDYARAQRAYRRAIGLNPFDSQAHFGLGRTLEAARQPGEALHEFEKGLETDPSDAGAKAAANRLRANLNPEP
jgi:Tfp pilus assembly protein PilF